jgi:hypothetical protein
MDPLSKLLYEADNSYGFRILNGLMMESALSYSVATERAITVRQAGVVLFHKRNERNSVKMLTRISDGGPFELSEVDAVFPDHLSVPPLEELICKEPEKMQNLLETKQQLLEWIVLGKNYRGFLKTIDAKYKLVVLTIQALVYSGILTVEESNLMLFIAEKVTNDNVPANVWYPRALTSKSIVSAIQYRKFYDKVLKCAETVGLPDEIMVIS